MFITIKAARQGRVVGGEYISYFNLLGCCEIANRFYQEPWAPDFTNFGVNNRECFTLKLGTLETSVLLFHSTSWAEHADCNQFKALPDLSTLTVLKTISRSHDEAQKSHGKQIHKPMEYTF